MKMENRRTTAMLAFILFCTRLPFLFFGYGSEEDAWALPLVAERIATSGHYEVSRLPGHPLQEIVYSLCWQGGAVAFNLLTALISTLGILFFYHFLKRMNVPHRLWICAALAFTPVVYINSTNAMDYTWALGFSLMALHFISKRNIFLAGGMLALATGCRITAGAMYLPLAFLILQLSEREVRFKHQGYFALSFLFSLALLFTPVVLEYGNGFLTFYEHFPLPSFARNLYKGSIGVWGLPGVVTLLLVCIPLLKRIIKNNFGFSQSSHRSLAIACITAIILYTIAFIRLPLKSAFLIPALPFLYILPALFLNEKKMQLLAGGMLLSCFIGGINLADDKRGSGKSALALSVEVEDQAISFDLCRGIFYADIVKRQQRTAFSKRVLKSLSVVQEKTIIIAGWWLADLLVLSKDEPLEHVTLCYYQDEKTLEWYKKTGYAIYYLEEQNEYNDLRFGNIFTQRYATKWNLSY